MELLIAKKTRCAMSFIRGINGYCLCPICLVPNGEQAQGHRVYLAQNTAGVQIIFTMKLKHGQKKKYLKQLSLQDVQMHMQCFLLFCLWLTIEALSHRISSGSLRTVIHTKHCLSIVSMHIIWDYLANISG